MMAVAYACKEMGAKIYSYYPKENIGGFERDSVTFYKMGYLGVSIK